MGEKRQRHFRHAVLTESCSLETYLHHTGKLLLYKTYQSCLKKGKKYEIEIYKPRICNYCNDITNYCKDVTICKMTDKLVKYDLTRYFKHIFLEKTDGGFIPDLLLVSDFREKIYIEIAVTHQSTPQKIASEIRIIEIKIENEDDFELLTSCTLSDKNPRVAFMNFNQDPIFGNFSTKCRNTVSVFILSKDGSAIMKSVYWHFYENHIKDKEYYSKIVCHKDGDTHSDTYKRELEQAYFDGLKVKNCFLCRYHGKPTDDQWVETGKSIFCKFQKKLYGSNHAARCSYYRPDRKVFRFSHH